MKQYSTLDMIADTNRPICKLYELCVSAELNRTVKSSPHILDWTVNLSDIQCTGDMF